MSSNAVGFRQVLLGLLDRQPMSGYDIKRLLNDLDWLVDGPSFGNIYTILHTSLEEGLVTVEVIPHQHKPPRKVYSITEAGRRLLQDWVDRPMPQNGSLKAFVMRLVLAGSYSTDRLIAQLEQRRAQVRAHGTTLAQAAEDPADGAELQHLVVSYGLALAKAELDWLDGTLNRLMPQPLPLEAAPGN